MGQYLLFSNMKGWRIERDALKVNVMGGASMLLNAVALSSVCISQVVHIMVIDFKRWYTESIHFHGSY